MEIWKDIKGYEGLYQVSSEGRLKSLDRIITKKTRWNNYITYTIKGKILTKKHTGQNRNYISYCLAVNGKNIYKSGHRLVAEAFIPNPENKPEVDHINCDASDNRVENLRWVTKEENMNNPITKERNSAVRKGKTSPMKGKLNRKDISKPILQLDLNGNFLKKWPSIAEAHRNGYDSGSVGKCCRGIYDKAYGYKWKYLA